MEEDLESSDEDESDVEDLETLVAKAAASAGGRADAGTVDTNSLIQWEIVKAWGKLNRKKESDSEEDEPRVGGTASGFAGIRKLRRRLRKAPRSVLARYREHVKQKLGVRHAAHRWEYRDYSLKLLPTFGKMKGLWRCHHLMSDILQRLEPEETDQAIGLTVQGFKALHQVALDGGGWDTALLLLPDEDPLARPAFGGEEAELEAAFRYKKSLRELRAQQGHRGSGSMDDGGEDAAGADTAALKTKVKAKAKAAPLPQV